MYAVLSKKKPPQNTRVYNSPLGCLFGCPGGNCAPRGVDDDDDEEEEEEGEGSTTFHLATCLPFSCRIAVSRSTGIQTGEKRDIIVFKKISRKKGTLVKSRLECLREEDPLFCLVV